MINLLPESEKNNIIAERKKRIAVILGFLILSFFIFLAISLISIKIYFYLKIEPQKILLEKVEETFEKEKEIKFLEKKIMKINLNLEKINTFYSNKIYYTEIIEKISQTLPNNMYLNNLVIRESPTEEEIISISILGSSPDRESLIIFRDNLREKEYFKNLYIPPSNWINPQNFSIFLDYEN